MPHDAELFNNAGWETSGERPKASARKAKMLENQRDVHSLQDMKRFIYMSDGAEPDTDICSRCDKNMGINYGGIDGKVANLTDTIAQISEAISGPPPYKGESFKWSDSPNPDGKPSHQPNEWKYKWIKMVPHFPECPHGESMPAPDTQPAIGKASGSGTGTGSPVVVKGDDDATKPPGEVHRKRKKEASDDEEDSTLARTGGGVRETSDDGSILD
eukprot:GFYU01015683.1.p1 GENE.GFYU01015683.1~~GFYU01015683.1.p1  ORF type:complete len:248 (+),score=83.73 GFYU01015683.1:100-744(+)